MSRRTQSTPMSAPLPDGWTYFLSEADPVPGGQLPQWYATAPYRIPLLPPGKGRGKLDQTVSAPTWAELHRLVAEQVETYNRLTG
ncbi:hypothetical protein [Streptomyces sp. NEAU-YJ-81]|uniref:hypothetical protein n=1 Tax=Streptomyces sp. NEAU-YJ-81 TaxID=2820288 RepID=UPI001ABC45D0|nr:hypothetical protein [Streptomyces sp. NEAU-YJ-81]MBO3674859.1 hypothetical protein [Streptomyces sp. NEAU-YJ-81]